MNEKELSYINHHNDLKHLSEMIDNIIFLYKKGWNKGELKSFIDKYCLDELVETNKNKEDYKNKGSILNSYKA